MPRPLGEQVVVLTGASSGIGREAAVMLGQRGASIVLAARDEAALRDVASAIELAGSSAHVVPTDVAEWPQVERLASEAVRRFGRIDTWVNNAGITVGGTVEDTEIDEIERLVRVNLLGQIFGVKAALPFMKREGRGAFINVASVAGVRAFPLQTVYCATKHGVKALCEGLRLELEREPGEYHVTMIAPPSVNTPLFEQARTKFGTELAPPSPIYEPEIVAASIVHAAEHPRRDIFIGGGKLLDLMERLSPPLTDWYMARGGRIFKEQVSDRPRSQPDNLFQPPAGHRSVRGSHGAKAKPASLYTMAFEWHPLLKPLTLGTLALGAVALASRCVRDRRGAGRRGSGGWARFVEAIR